MCMCKLVFLIVFYKMNHINNTGLFFKFNRFLHAAAHFKNMLHQSPYERKRKVNCIYQYSLVSLATVLRRWLLWLPRCYGDWLWESGGYCTWRTGPSVPVQSRTDLSLRRRESCKDHCCCCCCSPTQQRLNGLWWRWLWWNRQDYQAWD